MVAALAGCADRPLDLPEPLVSGPPDFGQSFPDLAQADDLASPDHLPDLASFDLQRDLTASLDLTASRDLMASLDLTSSVDLRSPTDLAVPLDLAPPADLTVRVDLMSTDFACAGDGSSLTDPQNCGACGNVCPARAPACVDGVCTPTHVALLGAPATPSWLPEVQAGVQATGAFAVVDIFNIQMMTPTLDQLNPYGAILVFTDTPGAQNPTAIGDLAADFFDAGGQVVFATFAMVAGSPLQIRGRFGTVSNGYLLIDIIGGQEEPVDTLGTVLEPQSPLMVGVSTLSASHGYRVLGGPVNGGVVVAQWQSDGRPLIVRGVVNGRKRVDLNFFPPSVASRSDFWTGDGFKILRNALLYR